MASPPAEVMAATVAAARGCDMSTTATRAPHAAIATAVAAPVPYQSPAVPAPVIRATLPASRPAVLAAGAGVTMFALDRHHGRVPQSLSFIHLSGMPPRN
jgi:hypothetical protein